jgi:raffinose/stachyose/melibiose transport system substrate-binding protein
VRACVLPPCSCNTGLYFPFAHEPLIREGSAEPVIKILHVNPIPKVLEIWQAAGREYEKTHPGAKIQFEYLENEDFKAKLPTLLQSEDRPTIFHSWGGGVMLEQIQAGICQDITNAIAGDFEDSFYPAGIDAFKSQGKSYGLPDSVGPIVFWYNRELCKNAGVDPKKIKYWEDMLDVVKQCKTKGITPISVGGSEKWPLQFYPALLMMRILGKDGMASAYKGDHGGFAGSQVVKAWNMYRELCDMDPFQDGFETASPREAVGSFHDGKAAFHLQAGVWVLELGRTFSADRQGLSDDKLGWLSFPEIQEGGGTANDIFGSVYGWLVSRDAPKDTIDFMKVWLGKDVQTKLAAEGLSVPMVKGISDAIRNPFYKALSLEVHNTGWICVAMDQLFGRASGRIFNDEAAAVAIGAKSPEQAVQAIETSWSENRI